MLKTIIVNTGSNVALMLVRTVLTFIMTPVIVRSLGNHDYGIWELVTAVLGYMGLMQVGVTPAASRFAARLRAQKDQAGLERLLATTVTFMLVIATVGAAILVAWALTVPEKLGEGAAGDGQRYAILLFVVAGQLLYTFPGLIFESFLEGYQRYAIKNNYTILNAILGAVVFLSFYDDVDPLLLVAGVTAGGRLLNYSAYIWLLRFRLEPPVRLRLSAASTATLREVLGFGIKSFMMGVATRITTSTDRFLIGGFLSPAMIVFYTLPLALIQRAIQLRMTLTHAFMPAFSDLDARGRGEEMARLLFRGTRVASGILMLILLGMLALGADFIGVWVGEQYVEQARQLLPVMMVGPLLSALHPFTGRLLMALNAHGGLARAALAAGVMNVILSIALVFPLGLFGIALATALTQCGLEVYGMRCMARALDIRLLAYMRRTCMPLLPPVILSGCTFLALRRIILLDDYSGIVTVAFAMSAVYGLAFLLFTLKGSDRAWFLRRLRGLKR